MVSHICLNDCIDQICFTLNFGHMSLPWLLSHSAAAHSVRKCRVSSLLLYYVLKLKVQVQLYLSRQLSELLWDKTNHPLNTESQHCVCIACIHLFLHFYGVFSTWVRETVKIMRTVRVWHTIRSYCSDYAACCTSAHWPAKTPQQCGFDSTMSFVQTTNLCLSNLQHGQERTIT